MRPTPSYPTPEHERAAEAITEHYSKLPEVEAVLLLASPTRGRASRDSDLDVLVLVRPEILATERAALKRLLDEYVRE